MNEEEKVYVLEKDKLLKDKLLLLLDKSRISERCEATKEVYTKLFKPGMEQLITQIAVRDAYLKTATPDQLRIVDYYATLKNIETVDSQVDMLTKPFMELRV